MSVAVCEHQAIVADGSVEHQKKSGLSRSFCFMGELSWALMPLIVVLQI
jgi:hypothetical protein